MSEQVKPIAADVRKALDRLNTKAVFGEPLHEGDVTLIPVAEVSMGFGYGYGSGPAPDEQAEEAPAQKGGVGGGGGGKAKPLGYIQIDRNGVHFEPVLDITRMGMAGILMTAWAVFWIARAFRRGRR